MGIDPISARTYRPCFCENKPKTFVFSHRKLAFWACFHKNRAYKFGHSILKGNGILSTCHPVLWIRIRIILVTWIRIRIK